MQQSSVDVLYNDIIMALSVAEIGSVPRIHLRSLKPFWTAELDELKQQSIMWHNIWGSNGRPSSGTIHHIKSSKKLQYKKAIKDACINFEHNNNDYIDAYFRGKSTSEFWKVCKRKLSKYIDKEISINGLNDNLSIANAILSQCYTMLINLTQSITIRDLTVNLNKIFSNPLINMCLISR